MRLGIVQQRFVLADFFKTEDMVKELDFCDQRSFPLLYAFKCENEAAQAALQHEVAAEFRANKGNVKVYEQAEKMNRQVAQKRQRLHQIKNIAN